jgi:3-oxoacyl-[acyl-carrier protein] reductase
VEMVAAEITAAGGRATAGTLDVLQPETIHRHLEDIVARTGRLDISFNATGFEDVQGLPLTEMTLADVARPVELAVASHFNTATAAVRHMTLAGSGVILGITA